MTLLSREQIINALNRLGELAHESGQYIELVVVGGAAMVLLYGNRESTQDIDVLILAPGAALVRKMAQQVAEEFGLDADWLNDGAKGFLFGFQEGRVLHSSVGISVIAPALAQLLAMKLSAWRDDVDIDDARHLLTSLQGTQSEIWQAIQSHLIPGAELKAWYAFLDLWELVYGTD